MAKINSTRQFHNEVCIIVTALESMQYWVESESEKVGGVLYPLTARLHELLDQADGIVSPDEI